MQAFSLAHSGGQTDEPTTAGIALAGAYSSPGFVMSFSRNEEIFGEEETADFAYKVISGAVRVVQMLDDGRRQISAFHRAGEVFGLEMGPCHRSTAEAVNDCQIALIRRSHLLKAAQSDLKAAYALWTLAASRLERAEEHLRLLGRKSASERVGAFLLEMSARAGDADIVELPMSRTDIADYLGLTIETVSRSLTQMERDGAIALPSCRRVVLKRRHALKA